ncbi:MAG: ABC transporter substrate-binding protein [Betaproteobacteria bacterium]|nr:ABC transporter substrate-binding protein [Betaproteobacteria bacterium]
MTRRLADRRNFLAASALGLGAFAMPAWLRAQGAPIRIATLVPMTGAGGTYGPVMNKAAQMVVAEVNAAGGIFGRKIELLNEDDQTSPEAGVRAARKLIDVDKVVAICGTWASSVTSAVAPLCWESKTFLATVSGADSITQLPHQGYLVRTQPTTTLQGRKFGEFALELGAKKTFFMGPQTPFTQSMIDNIGAAVKKGGGDAQSLVYEDKKTSYRGELDQALKSKPDLIFLGGYVPDTTVLLRDIFRAGYKGRLVGFAYGVNQKLIDAVPAEVVENVYTIAPSPASTSNAYKRLAGMLKIDNVDPYTCQVYDQVNLMIMALAKAGQVSGTAIRDNIRLVSQAATGAKAVDNAPDGLKAIAARQAINYDGASGPCQFTDKGDISDSRFRYEQIKGARINLLKIV